MSLFLLLLAQAASLEYIIKFDFYDLRCNLLANHIHAHLPTYEHRYSPMELNSPSDFLLVDSGQTPQVPTAQAVLPNALITRKPLIFKAGSKGAPTTALLPLEQVWQLGLTGESVKVAILDSGLSSLDIPDIAVEECVNFTEEPDCEDRTGHGTYMASLLKSTRPDCPGVAPNAQLYALKVFSQTQESYTSWFLEALNFALNEQINIVSLSTGGIDYSEAVFVEKIQELINSGIMVIAAAGNDGPGFGTMNNPADQPEVIAVGGIDEKSEVAEFSSRGPTLWEVADGAGRVKPDLVTAASDVLGLYQGRCIKNSGTSVATPIVAGAAALLFKQAKNSGHLRQALMASSQRIDGFSMFEQGAGALRIMEALAYLQKPLAIEALPNKWDQSDAYFYPYSLQPLYPGSLPTIFNVTFMSPYNWPLAIKSIRTSSPRLRLSVEAPESFELFTACMGVFVQLLEYEDAREWASVELESNGQSYVFSMNFTAAPAQAPRIVWDLSHNVKFPEKRVIRDEAQESYLYDWRGDHPFTNMISVYETLLSEGYIVDFLFTDFTCVPSSYAIYLIIDNELPFSPQQIQKLRFEVESQGVGLLIFAEWDDELTLETQTAHTNITDGVTGSNTRSLNQLLEPYFIELSTHQQMSGSVSFNQKELSVILTQLSMSSVITRFPAQAWLITQKLVDSSDNRWKSAGVVGMAEVGLGTVSVLTDSSCLDPSVSLRDCLWLLQQFLGFAVNREKPAEVFRLPYDYDVHVEEHRTLMSVDVTKKGRREKLTCQGGLAEARGEGIRHARTGVKIREWAPSSEPFASLDALTVIQLGISVVLVLVLGFVCLSVKRRRRYQSLIDLSICQQSY